MAKKKDEKKKKEEAEKLAKIAALEQFEASYEDAFKTFHNAFELEDIVKLYPELTLKIRSMAEESQADKVQLEFTVKECSYLVFTLLDHYYWGVVKPFKDVLEESED